MEGPPISPAQPSRGQKRPRKGGNDGKKDQSGNKKAYIPSYVQPGEKCVVCGDNSTGTHYRAMTCEGCKGFFRRTIQKSKKEQPNLVCKKEGKCEITPQTRNSCQHCRYKKCVDMKMDPGSVLSDMERSNLQQLIDTNRQERSKKSKNAMSNEEWTELKQMSASLKSALVHTFFKFPFRSIEEARLEASNKAKKSQDGSEVATVSHNTSAVARVVLDVSRDAVPGVWHALSFVRSIPGIDKIGAEDLLALVRVHLIDILVFLMTEVYNEAKNELCFSDFCLRESDVEKIYPEMKEIFKFVKYYSRFFSSDNMVFACFCAARFLNADGVVLKDQAVVDQALDYMIKLSLKYWGTLENKKQLNGLWKGLAEFETIRYQDLKMLDEMTSMTGLGEKEFCVISPSNLLHSHSEGLSPEYMNRSSSTASSSGSSTIEDEVQPLRLEVDYEEVGRFEQGVANSFTGNTSEEFHENMLQTPAVQVGNGYPWRSGCLLYPSPSYSGGSEGRWSTGSDCSSSLITANMSLRMDTYLQSLTGQDMRGHGVFKQENLGVIEHRSPEIVQQMNQSTPERDFHIMKPKESQVQLAGEYAEFMTQKIDHQLCMRGTSGVLKAQNMPEELAPLSKEFNASNFTKMQDKLKHCYDLLKKRGINPDLEGTEDSVPGNYEQPSQTDRLHTFASILPATEVPSCSQDFSILHHPEVSQALSSLQLSFGPDGGNRSKCHSSSSFVHHQNPSSSLLSHYTSYPFPGTSQDVKPVPEFSSDSFRLQSPSEQFIARDHLFKDGQNRTYWHSPYHEDKFSSFKYGSKHSTPSFINSNVSPMPFLSQATVSSTVISSPIISSSQNDYSFNNVYSGNFSIPSYDGNHNKVPVYQDPKEPFVPFTSKSYSNEIISSPINYSSQKYSSVNNIISEKVRTPVSDCIQNHVPVFQDKPESPIVFTSKDAHSSASFSSPVNLSLPKHSSGDMNSKVKVSAHSTVSEPASLQKEPKISAAIGLKKKWMQTHFNMKG